MIENSNKIIKIKQKNIKSKIIENSFWEVLSKITEKIGTIIFTIIVARFLMPEGFGIYSLTLSVSLIFISALDYAADTTSIRYVSQALSKGNEGLAASYFKYIFKIKIIILSVFSISLIILSYPLAMFVFKKDFLFSTFFISGFYILGLSTTNYYDSSFYSTQRIKGRLVKTILQQILRVIFLFLTVLFVTRQYQVHGILIGMITTNIIVLLFILLYIRKFSVFLINFNKNLKIDKKIVHKFFFYLLIVSILGLLLMYIDILFLGFFIEDIKYIGLYSSAINLIWGISGFISFSTIFLPTFTSTKKSKINGVLNKVLKFSFMISIPLSFGIFVMSRYVLFFIYGREYLDASIVLSILSFLIIEIINGGYILALFTAKEKLKYSIKIHGVSLILNIILSYILIKSLLVFSSLYAIIGAAIAVLISRYFTFILTLFFARKKFNIKIPNNLWLKPLFSSIIMVIILILLNKFIIKDMNLITGFIEILFGIIIYFGILILIKGISKEDLRTLNIRNPYKN